MFKLVKDENGDAVIKYREKGKVIYIRAEQIDPDLTSWDLVFMWNGNRQYLLDKAYEYLIISGLLEE